MTNVAPRPARRQTGVELAVGLAAGALLSLLASFMPILAIVGVGLAMVATWVGFFTRPTRFPALAGATLGAGVVLLWGLVMTVQSCLQTSNFCGDANLTPLLAFAGVAAATGAIGSVVALMRGGA
jgi:hypothetical protein